MNPKGNLKETVEQIQRQLSISDLHSERRLLRVVENLDPRVFSEKGFDYFLIPINADETDEQERLEGLFVSIEKNLLEGAHQQSFLQIKTQSSRREIFTPFIAELMSKDLAEPINALDETLNEWREFWTGKRGRLSKHKQIGLLGELISLNALHQCIGPSAVTYWGGPMDWIHDFQSESLDLEVKTTTMQPASVYISMISQVAPMKGDKELHLIVVGLEEGNEISLPGIVSKLRKDLSGSDKVQQFEKVLARSGYRDIHASHYSREYGITYVLGHKITKESPVLNPNVLGEIPSTVTNIKYRLQVHAMDMAKIGPDEWKDFALKM